MHTQAGAPEAFAGQTLILQELLKNGAVGAEVTLPSNPVMQEHPAGTFAPELLIGHDTAAQEELKNGDAVMAVTTPLNPSLHLQPARTFIPVLLDGQIGNCCRQNEQGVRSFIKIGLSKDAASI